MDFLDPKKRRAYNIRLIIGYILVAIVICLATVLINYGVSGYGFNAKTGQIVQNGLLFVDSKPNVAEIYLNKVDQNSTTSARLVIPSGKYTLTLKKDGYRDWSREFVLNELAVARYVYPFMFPTKPVTTNLKNYDSLPAFATESPDYKWLLIENNTASLRQPTFDQYDMTTLDKTSPDNSSVSLPVGLLTNYSPQSSKLTEVEWSTDNQNLLVQHDYVGGSEFVVINRAHPEQSFNVNQMFNLTPAQVSLRDKKVDQLYLLSANGDLMLGDTTTKTVSSPIIQQVIAYKSYSTNLITYVTAVGEPAGTVAAKIWDRGQAYKLNEFKAGNKYLIDLAEFQNHFYYVAASDTADRINIYKDPLNGLKDPSQKKALPMIALHNPGATKLKFSNNARFIGTEGGQTFAIYDLETQTRYQYTLSNPLTGNMTWMDGHRLLGDSDGKVIVMDYDGINKQFLVPTLFPQVAYFNNTYNHLLTVTASDNGTSFSLKDTDTRAGVDLPKK